MRFEVFEKMTNDEADDYLKAFLAFGKQYSQQHFQDVCTTGFPVDYTTDSICPLMLWILPRLGTYPRSPAPDVPCWIQNTREYRDGLWDFDDKSQTLLLFCAYYIGESFVSSFADRLRWTKGKADFAEFNMPVVTGFSKGLQMAPLMITINLFRRIIIDPTRTTDIATAIRTWMSLV